MLCRDAEPALEAAALTELFEKRLILAVDLSRVEQEFRAVVRQCDSVGPAVENRYPKFLLELPERSGQ